MRRSPSRIAWDDISGHYIFTRPDGTTEDTISGAPGGSDKQFQWNNAGSFAGASGLVWVAGTSRPDMPNGWSVTVSTQVCTFAVTPTAARTITFFDATDTVVGRQTTDTLTGKTMVAASNTITDTSAATGDLFVFNGTRFARKAQGANGTFWGVSGGVAGYFTPSAGGSPGGSSGQVQWNSGGSFAGATNWTTDGTALIASASGYEQFGSTAPALSGWCRFQAAAADILVLRRADNAQDNPLIAHDGSNAVTVGSNIAGTHAVSNISVQATTTAALGTTAAAGITVTTSVIKTALPVAGSSGSSIPMRFETASISMTTVASGTTVATAAQYECPFLAGTNGNSSSCVLQLPLAAGAYFNIANRMTGGTGQLNVTGPSTTGVNVAPSSGKGCRSVRCNVGGTDYELMEVP